MEKLAIEGSDITPRVLLDKESNVFEHSGRSLPEDVKNFYSPIIHWLDGYIQNPNPITNLLLDFEYFNTASSKMILIILNKIRELQRNGKEVLITWKYPQFDAELEEAGEEYAELLNIPFEFIPKA